MSSISCKRRRSRVTEKRATRTAAGRASRRSCLCLCKVASEEETAVAERLALLKELVTSATVVWRSNVSGCGKAAAAAGDDRLFQEAAEYIILLKARVDVLQRMLQVCGGSGGEQETDP